MLSSCHYNCSPTHLHEPRFQGSVYQDVVAVTFEAMPKSGGRTGQTGDNQMNGIAGG